MQKPPGEDDLSSSSVGDFAAPTEIINTPPIKKFANVPVKNISELKSVNATKKERPAECTEFDEEPYRHLFFLRRYTFICKVVVYDATAFSIIYSAITNKLLEWRRRRGSGTGGFHLIVVTNPEIFNRVKLMIDTLHQDNGIFRFVSKMKVTLELHDVNSGTISFYVPGSEAN